MKITQFSVGILISQTNVLAGALVILLLMESKTSVVFAYRIMYRIGTLPSRYVSCRKKEYRYSPN